ncbi:MAG: BACON domain-containing protein [Bacteroidales bacterium]|nr:BACON domain-containing protein [Bacteroidales bacterium]
MKKILFITTLILLTLTGCDPKENKVQNPSFENISSQEISIPAEGGEFSVTYQLNNPIEGEVVDVEIDVEWITLQENNSTDGELKFIVSPNLEQNIRETSINVTYAEVATFSIDVIQSESAATMIATAVNGYYYGEEYSPGVGNYWMIISEKPIEEYNNTFYRVDLYGELSSIEYGESYYIPVPAGTYTFDPNNTSASGTFSATYSAFWQIDETGAAYNNLNYQDGSITITENGFTLDVTIEGERHVVVYEGESLLEDRRPAPYYSTLTGDHEINIGSNATAMAYMYDDFYGLGTTNWLLTITPVGGIGEYLRIDLVTNHPTNEDGISGEYSVVAEDDVASGTVLKGYMMDVYMQGSWWYDSEDSITMNNLAPFTGGSMTIMDNEDGSVTISLNITDDMGNKITGEWSGTFQKTRPSQMSSKTNNFVYRSL